MSKCNGNIYNIGMGCCQPVLAPIENYYTKYEVDKLLEEIESGITSGCCITPEEVDDKISSAITDVESEIPSLDGYATEEWVLDKHYITGVDLSDYVTDSEMSAYTYSKNEIDEKIASGGTFDPTQYYKKSETSSKTEIEDALNSKLDASAYTPTDLSEYWTSAQTQNAINQTVSGKQDTLSAGTNITINNNVISAVDTTYEAGDGISISGRTISTVTKFQCLTEQEWGQISGGTLDNNTIYMIH